MAFAMVQLEPFINMATRFLQMHLLWLEILELRFLQWFK